MSQPRNIIMESIGVYHPPESVSTAEVLEGCSKRIRFPLEKITGIKSRPMAGKTEFSIDLAKQAVADCMSKSKYTIEDVDLIICTNISRYDGPQKVTFEPGTAVRLKEHFGFVNALAFDVANACAGMFTGIYLVNSFIQTGVIRRGMVVSGEYISHLTRTAQQEVESYMDERLACLTLGDAGAAVLLEAGSGDNVGFLEMDLATLGAYSWYCTAKTTDFDHGGFIMLTDSVKLTDVALKAGAKHSLSMLEKVKWTPESVQQLIMHQTSTMTLTSARKEINRLLEAPVYHDENTVNNLEKRGNSASTTHLVAIYDQIQQHKINAGDKIVFSISASGITVGTALYVFDGLPDRIRNPQGSSNGSQKKPEVNAVKNQLKKIRITSIGTAQKDDEGEANSIAYACEAANRCIANSGQPRNSIDLIIYCGVYRTDYLVEPAYAALLAGELEINSTGLTPGSGTLAFDIFNGAVGFLNACHVVQNLMSAQKCRRALIISSEFENNAQFFPNDLLGVHEGASAVLLESDREDKKCFSRFHFGYRTEKVESYITHWTHHKGKPFLNIKKDEDLEMEYISCIVSTVIEFLDAEGFELKDFHKIFPPQISSYFISALGSALGIPSERFVNVVGEGPDLFSSSGAFALENALTSGVVHSGDLGLVISVGSGIQVGCAIYHF